MPTFQEVPVADYLAAVGDTGQLIDVREVDEFARGTLPGAVNIPLGELPASLHRIDLGRPVVLLCRSGNRSRQAAEFLAASGYQATNLDGGMLAVDDN